MSFCDAPRSLEARVRAVQELGSSAAGRCLASWPQGSVLVDGPGGDAFLSAFKCWPLRFFGLVDSAERSGQGLGGGKEGHGCGAGDGDDILVGFKAMPGEESFSYHLEDLEAWLEAQLETGGN